MFSDSPFTGEAGVYTWRVRQHHDDSKLRPGSPHGHHHLRHQQRAELGQQLLVGEAVQGDGPTPAGPSTLRLCSGQALLPSATLGTGRIGGHAHPTALAQGRVDLGHHADLEMEHCCPKGVRATSRPRCLPGP